jgi:RHS repeat-associated protein
MASSWWTFAATTTNDPCAAAASLAGDSLTESAPGLYKDLASKCKDKTGTPPKPPVPAQTKSVPPGSSGSDQSPNPPDDPYQEGAPSTDTSVSLSGEHSPYDVNPQRPTDDIYAPNNPTRPEVAVDSLKPDATPDEAQALIDFLLQNRPMEGQPDPSRSGETTRFPSKLGDPVDLFRGLLSITNVDLQVPTPLLPLRLVRRYESARPYFGPWGFGWDHNFNVYLRELADGGVARWTGELHEDYFRWTGDAFEPERGVHDRLERLEDGSQGYILTRPGGIKLHFARPTQWTDAERIPLVEVQDRHGSFQILKYDEMNRLMRVEDEAGRALIFQYGDCGLLEGLEDHTGRHVQYVHHPEIEHLVSVVRPPTAVYPMGASTSYEYDFLNDHPALQHNLVRIVDADGNTYLQTLYGDDPLGWSFNRVISQLYGDFLYEYAYEQIQYVPEDAQYVDVPSVQTTMTTSDGAVHSYTFNYRGDLLDSRFRLSLDGSYRIAASAWEYDAQGNVIREVHPDGSSTAFTYDSENPNPCARGTLLKVERFAGPEFVATSRVVYQATYDPAYQLPVETITENGSSTRFIYDFDTAPGPGATGKLVRIEWPDVALPDGGVQQAVTQIETNKRGQVTAVVSPEGSRREISYMEEGTIFSQFLREEERDVGGLAVVTQYDYQVRPNATGFLLRRTNEAGHVTEYLTDARGDLEEMRLPAVDGIVDTIRYRHDANGNVREIEHPRGEYDDATISEQWIRDNYFVDCIGHLVKRVLGSNTASQRIHYAWPDFEGRAAEETDASGITTRRSFDERGLLLSEIAAFGTAVERETRFIYDRAGRMLKRTDPGGRSTQIEYDSWGRPAAITLPSGTVIRSDWGADDVLLSRTIEGVPEPGGAPRVLERTAFAYDERDRLVRTTHFSFTDDVATAVELPIVHWYDRDGRLLKRQGPRGAEWINEYDGLGRQVRAQDPLGNAVLTQYDPTDLPVSIITEDIEGTVLRSRSTAFDHDPRGRLTTRTSAAGISTIRYDARDLPVEEVNPIGTVTQYAFGLLGEVVRQTVDVGGLGLVTEQQYDILGRPTGFSDPTLEQTLVARDPLGRVVTLTLPDQTTWSFSYDGSGNLTSLAAPGGSTVTFAYDVAGRLATLTSIPGPGRASVSPHTYTYDGLDRIVRASADGTTITRSFDALGRLVIETTADRTFARSYDDLGGKATLEYPDGRIEENVWDLLGRVRRIALVQPGGSAVGPGSGASGAVLLDVTYAGPARVFEMQHGNGVVTRWHYDDEGRAVRVDHLDASETLLESARYRHDAASRRRVVQILGPPAESLLHYFDAHDRLTQVRGNFPIPPLTDADTQITQDLDIASAESSAADATIAETYMLDAADTRISTITTTQASTNTALYTSLPGHRVAAVDGEVISYDPDGQRTADATRLFTYDALGRCVAVRSATTQAVVAQFSYDPLGRMSGGDFGDGPFYRVFFGPSWLQEETAGNLVRRQRTVHPSLMVAALEWNEQGLHHLHLDGHFNLVLATDAGGVPAERFLYAPFGMPTILKGDGSEILPASAIGLQPMFGGTAYCRQAQLFVTPRRLYDPRLGLFLSRDPDAYRASSSPYAFGHHDPVNLADPHGDVPVWLITGLAVGVITAAAVAISIYRSNPDAGIRDYLVLGGIGFASGFVGGATFGLASSAIESTLLSWGVGAWRAGSVGSALWNASEVAVPIAVSATSEAFGGAITSAGAGAFSGYASGLYQGYRYGGPGVDPWEVASQEASQEFVTGAVSGFVGGGMVGGLRVAAALPSGAYSALRSGAPMSAGLWARGLAGPYGLGGFAIGYTSSLSGTVARQWMHGDAIDLFDAAAQRDALLGGGISMAMPWLVPHPYTTGGEPAWGDPIARMYWSRRLNPGELRGMDTFRRGISRGQHHMLSWSAYPEHALDPLNLRPYGSQAQHQSFHHEWGSVPGRSFSSTPTHGPYVPGWPGAFGFHTSRSKP